MLIIFSIVLAQFSLSHAWDYRNQDQWASRCLVGIAQSPINLVTASAKPIEDVGYVQNNWDKEHNVTATNTGRTIMVTMDDKEPISFSGGGLPGTFNLEQFHFHWNSEHTVNGQRKALEAHFITYNTKFSNASEARNYLNGVAAFSVIFNWSTNDNEILNPIVGQLGKLKAYKNAQKITLNLRKLLPNNLREFYRYWGSVARPDCQETVIWTIFSQFGSVSQAQVNSFKSLEAPDGHPIESNYRNIQATNGRTLYKYSLGGS